MNRTIIVACLLPLATGLEPSAVAAMSPCAMIGYDAQVMDWGNRADTNFSGGNVQINASTKIAATVFMRDLRNYSLLSKIYRLNLFAGSGFSPTIPASAAWQSGGVATPLIATYGHPVEFGAGSSGNPTYTETGAAGGLNPGTSNMGLDTGLVPTNVYADVSSCHFMGYWTQTNNKAAFFMCGVDSVGAHFFGIAPFGYSDGNIYGYAFDVSNTGAPNVSGVNGGFAMISRTSNTSKVWYVNGSSAGSDSTSNSGEILPNFDHGIFYQHYNGVPSASAQCTNACAGYSIGLGMTSTEALNYYTAWQRFETALYRQQ